MKLCVLDLDGTLIKENSHLVILSKNYWFFSRFRLLLKVFCFLMPKSCKLYLDKLIEKRELRFSMDWFNINEIVINRIKELEIEGYDFVIVSNAPQKILNYFEDFFCINTYNAPVSRKTDILRENYSHYEYVYVITDNFTDIDLLRYSNKGVFITYGKVPKIIKENSNIEKWRLKK